MKANILIVDDDEQIRLLLGQMLKENGYASAMAPEAAAARELLNKQNFELILCDIGMPGESGLDLVRFAVSEYPKTAAIMVTGQDDPISFEESLEAGAYDYITKSFTTTRVLFSITNALKRRELEIANRAFREDLEKMVAERTAKLEENEQKYRLLINNIPGFVYQGYNDWSVDFIDNKVGEITGYDKEEFYSRRLRLSDIIFKEDIGAAKKCIMEALKADNTYIREYRIRTKPGKTLWIQDRGHIIRKQKGEIEYFSGIFFDITRQKQAEEALRKSERQVRLLLDSTAEAIYGLDMDGNCTFANSACVKFLGYKSVDELIGKNMHDLIHHTRPDGSPYPVEECNIYKAFKEGKGVNVNDEVLWRADGTSFPAEYWSYPIFHDDQVTGSVMTFLDITDRKQAENELKRAKAVAEAASIAKSEFLANMSHEIRTPMNGVIGMTSLLLDTELSTEQREYTETIRNSGDSLLTVINDVLDYSKIEAGKLEYEFIDFNLRVTLEEVSDLIALKAYEKGLEFGCMIHHEVPSLLCGDPGRLRQALINLVGNAVKFTDKGEVVIRATLENEDNTQATVRFSVTDTGIGIPRKQIDMIFKSFSQADGSTTRKYGGTGLGLAISKQLVEMMGGEIGVESEDGKGSEFWFTAVFPKQPQGREEKIVVPEDIRGKRILIVDDNATNRLILREQLKTWGCRYGEVASGIDALEELHKGNLDEDPYEIGILDMQMPGMTGETLGQLIKGDPELAKTVLIMLASIGMRGDVARLKEFGFAGYLTKPVKQSHLYDCLATAAGMQKEAEKERTAAIVTRHSISEDQKQKVRILLAEDNITNQKVALNILGKFGYRADAVANGREAVSALEMIPYDIVLMDIQMPEMDGLSATREIRKREEQLKAESAKSLAHGVSCNSQQSSIKRVPIIAMTAHAMKGDREKCLEAGMDDYTVKPINPQELLAKIEEWIMKAKEYSDNIEPVIDEVNSSEEKDESQTIDLDSALDRAMGDKSFLEMLLGEFIKSLPDQIDSLRSVIESEDAEALTRQAHTLKGESANLSADGISAVARQLENMGRAGDMSEGDQKLGELEAEINRLAKYVSQVNWVSVE